MSAPADEDEFVHECPCDGEDYYVGACPIHDTKTHPATPRCGMITAEQQTRLDQLAEVDRAFTAYETAHRLVDVARSAIVYAAEIAARSAFTDEPANKWLTDRIVEWHQALANEIAARDIFRAAYPSVYPPAPVDVDQVL